MDGDEGALGGVGEGEGVGEALSTAYIAGCRLTTAVALGDDAAVERATVGNAQVGELVLYLLVVVAGEGDVEVGIGFAYHSDSRLHIFELAFVHRDGGTLKPATLAQVPGEVAQEGQPVVAVGGVLRTGVDKFHRIGSLVVVVEVQRPGYHGVAVDGAGDAHLAGHELYPAVKHGVVVFPLSVDGQRALYHAAEGVFGLSVPGVVHDAGSDGLLAGVGKHLHHGEHGVEVLAAPQFHVHDTRHGVGVLPQVEVESPVFGRRQLAAAHLDLECHFGLLALVAGEDYLTFIYTRARDGRHPHVDPNRAGGAAGNTVDVGTIDHVGDHR